MVGLLVVAGFILTILSYVIFAPFFLEVDTRQGLLQIRWHRLAKVKLRMTDTSLVLDLRIAWWRREIDLVVQKPHKKEAAKKSKRSNISLQRIKAMIGSFKINKLDATLSFDNMACNGILYPIGWFIADRTNKNISINFWGENELVLEIENNLYRLIRAYVTSN